VSGVGLRSTNINSSKPHAFVNWILLDNQFNYVAASSGFSQVGNDTELHVTTLTNLPVTSSGYLYIYTSNEDPVIDVFFDNLQVTHMRGPLLEEDHYYPFGLTMAGISDKALKGDYAENKYRWNKGSELQNKEFSDGSGLEMYTTNLRDLDPQLGRWWQIDSKPDYAQSLHAAMGNNPVLHNDPLGDSIPRVNPREQVRHVSSDHARINRNPVLPGEKIEPRAPAAVQVTITKGAQFALKAWKLGLDVNVSSQEVAKADDYGPLAVDKDKTLSGGAVSLGFVSASQENVTSSKPDGAVTTTTTTETTKSFSAFGMGVERTWTTEQSNAPGSSPVVVNDTGPHLSGGTDAGSVPVGNGVSIGLYYKIEIKINPIQLVKNFLNDINTGH